MKRPRVVPSLILRATFAAVVPACAACGGTVDNGDAGSDGGKDTGSDVASDQFLGVFAVAYCCFDSGVADVGFAKDASDDGG